MALKHVLLTLLHRGPATGYDLTKAFDQGLGHFWQTTHQQVYREMAKLLSEGLVEAAKIAQAERPDKKVYRLKPAGERALQEWLRSPPPARAVNDEVLIRLLGGEIAGRKGLAQMLGAELENYRKRLLEYRAIEAAEFPKKNLSKMRLPEQGMYLALRKGILMEQARVQWAEEALRLLGA
jgi:DNA-binding PadR family transcriptional regulator